MARIAVVWATEAAGLYLLAGILPGVGLDGLDGAVSAVAVVGLLNALIWPLVTRVALPLFLWTMGLAALVLNGIIVLIASDLLPGFTVDGIPSGVLVALTLAVVNTVVSTVLAIDDQDSYYRRVVLRAARRAAEVEPSDVPGVLFLEIDGLSADALRRSLRDGHLPTLARWIQAGTHQVVPWECDLSSQTGASQAGLLHGNNEDMPAFRWYEKENERLVVSNNPSDAADLEQRISDGSGLLADGGASRGNLFSGDAPRTLFTLSSALKGRRPADAYAFFADPYNFTRTLVLAIADIGHEIVAAVRQRRRDVRPRVSRGGMYPLLRAATTVVLRDLNIYTLIGDMYRGVPSAYATFVGYDEVAHHSGIERQDALEVLWRLDRQFARLESAASLAPRPYRLAVLSDHGQSQGATFKQRFDETLEDVVNRSLGPNARVAATAAPAEGWGYLSGAATELAGEGGGAVSRTTRALTRTRSEAGAVTLGPDPTLLEEEGSGSRGSAEPSAADETAIESGSADETADESSSVDEEDAEAIVLASGCLGLVYLPRQPGRVTYEELSALHPELVPSLVAHPGIAFVLVHSEAEGGLVLGAEGRRRLADGAVEGADPLAGFGPNAARHLARTDRFPHAPDLLANSMHDPATGSVAAFEELVGSHGGIGGPQSRAFALVPSDWRMPEEPIVGAEAMHRTMVGWLVDEGAVEKDGEGAKPDGRG